MVRLVQLLAAIGLCLLPIAGAEGGDGGDAMPFDARGGTWIAEEPAHNLFVDHWRVRGEDEDGEEVWTELPYEALPCDYTWERAGAFRVSAIVSVERAGDYWFSLGADRPARVWINDELVWRSADWPAFEQGVLPDELTPEDDPDDPVDLDGFRADQYTGQFALDAGDNEIIFDFGDQKGTARWSLIAHLAPAEE